MDLTTMTKEEARAAIREVLTTYERLQALWIERFGTDTGFDAWMRKKLDEDVLRA